MKKIFAHLAQRIRRFATDSRQHDPGSFPESSPRITADFEEKADSGQRSNAPRSANSATSPNISPQLAHRPAQLVQKSTQAREAVSNNPEFITRRELQREMDLLRRLIESRK
jgi:hypothetical protein